MDRTSIISKEPSFLSTFSNCKTNGFQQEIQGNNFNQPHSNTISTSQQSPDSIGVSDAKWASKLLKECAMAMLEKDSSKIHHLLWMLNELASPYGDFDQKLASYFLQALFCKATNSGHRCYKTLISVAERRQSFDSARKLILRFQEMSPWTTFGHVASNGAMLEALEGETNIHIIDISNTLCTQWPTLLEALATRNDETPNLKLTIVVSTSILKSVMKDIAPRMEKFARLMGVPFEFKVINVLNRLEELTKQGLGVKDDETIAVNCINSLRRIGVEERMSFIQLIHSLSPKVVTIVEEDADFTSLRNDFVTCFDECLRFYSIYFDMLDESFPPTSNEKLMLERECSQSIIRVLACDDEIDHHGGNYERREKGSQWDERFRGSGFSPVGYSDDVVDDVNALLRRYRTGGWSLVMSGEECSGTYLTWKDEPVVWASVWKPGEMNK